VLFVDRVIGSIQNNLNLVDRSGNVSLKVWVFGLFAQFL